jgi:hypothetical protein
LKSNAQKVETRIEEEKGRWVVYLEVTFWESEQDYPLKTVIHRVQDFSTKKQAEVAAKLYRRTVDRDMEEPPFGL